MPTMNFTGIAIDPSSNIRAGDSIINEVCMTNTGTAGDIILYTGFGYEESGAIHYIGDGWGNGYSKETIGAVEINEKLCPYGMVSATQEVIDVDKSGKDVRFFASVESRSISKAVTFYEPPTPEFCIQVFEIIDQDGNPLNGTISSPTWDTDLPVSNTGIASMYMQKGITYTVTAHHADKTDTWSFTACQIDPVTFVIQVEPPIEEPDIPILTTTIINEEPYITGTNIGIETILKTPLGIPIHGDIVYFYTPTEFLGANFTNSEGKVTISFKTGNIPATYEIYATHLTDSDIFIESNHVVFTTEEPTIPYCIQKLRTLDQDGNILACKFSSTEFGDVFTSGEFEFNVEEGKTLIIIAYWYNLSLTKTITTCTTEPVDFIFDTEEPTCIDYTTQQECEDNGCYWHSDNTCQSAPEGTTEYFDVHIKPYSFYDGKYEEAVSKALTLVTDLTGAMADYVSSITGYEYKGIDILEDANKQVIVVRVYLKDTNNTTLVAPAIIAGAVIVIAAIMLTIGYIIGTSEGEFTKEEVIELIDNASDKAIEECKERYPNRTTDVSEAANFKHCVGGIETVRIIGSGDVIEEDSSEHIDYVINPTIVELDEMLDDGTLLPEDIDEAINNNLTIPTKDVVDDYKQTATDEDCAFEIAGTCIITKKAAKTLTVVAVGIGGLMALSAAKGITKK